MMKLEGALYPWRFRLMLGLLALMVGAIAWRIIDLQVVDRDFLIGQGDARSLRQANGQWRVESRRGPITADEVVACLGPQSADLFSGLGYQIPLAIKRGYHMHYSTRDGAQLEHSICDTQGLSLIHI